MPSKKVTSHTTAQSVAAERKDIRWKVTSMVIDNDAGGADRIIQIVDSFTTSATNGQSATVTTVTRYYITVIQGNVVNLNEEDLKGVVCLGAVTVLGDAIDTGCHITVGYEPDE